MARHRNGVRKTGEENGGALSREGGRSLFTLLACILVALPGAVLAGAADDMKPAVVRVVVLDQCGTGLILGGRDRQWLLTAAHVVQTNAEKITIISDTATETLDPLSGVREVGLQMDDVRKEESDVVLLPLPQSLKDLTQPQDPLSNKPDPAIGAVPPKYLGSDFEVVVLRPLNNNACQQQPAATETAYLRISEPKKHDNDMDPYARIVGSTSSPDGEGAGASGAPVVSRSGHVVGVYTGTDGGDMRVAWFGSPHLKGLLRLAAENGVANDDAEAFSWARPGSIGFYASGGAVHAGESDSVLTGQAEGGLFLRKHFAWDIWKFDALEVGFDLGWRQGRRQQRFTITDPVRDKLLERVYDSYSAVGGAFQVGVAGDFRTRNAINISLGAFRECPIGICASSTADGADKWVYAAAVRFRRRLWRYFAIGVALRLELLPPREFSYERVIEPRALGGRPFATGIDVRFEIPLGEGGLSR